MRLRWNYLRVVCLALASSGYAAAECIPYTEAPAKMGATVCVTGKVVKIGHSPRSNTHFLNFCDDHKKCPFTVVIFSRNLRDVGDVRWLEGKVIEIHGKIKDYNGQAEIILSDVRQLTGDAAKLPPLPKNYDASVKGSYSAGVFRPESKTTKPKKPKRTGDDADLGEADAGPPPN
ncbi:MAG: hypothetical protein ABIP81_06320 [Terriglobales bacterium]